MTCVFLGYLAQHRGYRCLDLSTNKIIISCHVIFDEDQFPFRSMTPDTPPSYDFLLPLNAPLRLNITPLTPPTVALNTTPPTLVPIPPTIAPLTSPTQFPQAQPTAAQQTIRIPSHLPSPHHPTPHTHAKARISKPLECINCHVTTTSPLPRSHLHALHDPNWHKAMVDKYNALISNETWALVNCPDNVNVVRSMWLFRHMFNADGSLSSPVIKPATIHTVLSLAVSRDWLIHQLNVKNSFLHGQLSETVYMHQPPVFVDSTHPDYVCHLQRSLYGLKQDPRSWFQQFTSFITLIGFQHSKSNTSLFVFRRGLDTAYLILYVDDIVLIAFSATLLQRIITLLHSEVSMTELGSLNYFLGISAQWSTIDTESKLSSDGDTISDPTLYHSLASALQYLTFTRLDISYVVQQVCLYMHDPREPHFTALKSILRYVRGTVDCSL
nr:ribonuclease H-like domain-containing protein [Tanacetum cinerariifolium]